ncbi:sucrose phosphorylase, partial [Streptococcus suis]
DEQQIDLDVTTETTRRFIHANLEQLAEHGASILRLDAFAYANKKLGTNCFFVAPDIWEMLHVPRPLLAPREVDIFA